MPSNPHEAQKYLMLVFIIRIKTSWQYELSVFSQDVFYILSFAMFVVFASICVWGTCYWGNITILSYFHSYNFVFHIKCIKSLIIGSIFSLTIDSYGSNISSIASLNDNGLSSGYSFSISCVDIGCDIYLRSFHPLCSTT